jgi:hypothetical protein
MNREIQVGDRVVLERLPESVRADDVKDDIFRECLGRELVVVSVEQNGDLELDVRSHSGRFVSIFVPAECVTLTRSL